MSDYLLHIEKLFVEVEKGKKEILSGINLKLRRGSVTGIVGESGSGKSVTALSLLGLLPPALKINSGNIFWNPSDSEPLNMREPGIREGLRGKKIAMIFQEPMTSLNPSMRCGRQMEESLILHSSLNKKERKEKIYRLLKKVKLDDPGKIYQSYPHQISGGQRQRVMIAMSLANDPELLLADEPTTALDVTVQKEIIQLLADLQREYKLTVMFITHDLRLLGEIARDIIVMRKGQIVEKGSKADIFNKPQHAYTRALLSCQPSLEKRPERLLTVEDFENSEPESLSERKIQIFDQPLLSIQNLNLHYSSIYGKKNKSFQALKNIDLHVYKGETLGLAGESGCGKTSLGKSILGLVQTGSGDILYQGQNLPVLTKKELKKLRKNIQVVFQDPYSSLNPVFKVGKVLNEARKIHFPREVQSDRQHFIKDLIQKTGLQISDLEKYPHEFSGGQRQRIGIARALAVEPEFLILDESVSALDVSVQARILNLLNKLKEEFRLTYLFISHDLAVVKYMSDRIIIMKDGEIIESGNPDQVYKNPETEYTRTLISSIPGSSRRIR